MDANTIGFAIVLPAFIIFAIGARHYGPSAPWVTFQRGNLALGLTQIEE